MVQRSKLSTSLKPKPPKSAKIWATNQQQWKTLKKSPKTTPLTHHTPTFKEQVKQSFPKHPENLYQAGFPGQECIYQIKRPNGKPELCPLSVPAASPQEASKQQAWADSHQELGSLPNLGALLPTPALDTLFSYWILEQRNFTLFEVSQRQQEWVEGEKNPYLSHSIHCHMRTVQTATYKWDHMPARELAQQCFWQSAVYSHSWSSKLMRKKFILVRKSSGTCFAGVCHFQRLLTAKPLSQMTKLLKNFFCKGNPHHLLGFASLSQNCKSSQVKSRPKSCSAWQGAEVWRIQKLRTPTLQISWNSLTSGKQGIQQLPLTEAAFSHSRLC